MVGGAIPGLVVLGSIREQAEQARGSKPVRTSLHGLCISSCFLICLSSSLPTFGDEQQGSPQFCREIAVPKSTCPPCEEVSPGLEEN